MLAGSFRPGRCAGGPPRHVSNISARLPWQAIHMRREHDHWRKLLYGDRRNAASLLASGACDVSFTHVATGAVLSAICTLCTPTAIEGGRHVAQAQADMARSTAGSRAIPPKKGTETPINSAA